MSSGKQLSQGLLWHDTWYFSWRGEREGHEIYWSLSSSHRVQMLNTDKKTSMRGQKTSMWGHHSLLAHFLALHADHADQMQGHEPQLSILITKTSTRAGNRPTKKEHMIEQQQNKHVLQLLPNCSLGSSTRCSCWSEHRALLPDSSICSVEHTDRQRCPFVKHTDRLRTSPQVQ